MFRLNDIPRSPNTKKKIEFSHIFSTTSTIYTLNQTEALNHRIKNIEWVNHSYFEPQSPFINRGLFCLRLVSKMRIRKRSEQNFTSKKKIVKFKAHHNNTRHYCKNKCLLICIRNFLFNLISMKSFKNKKILWLYLNFPIFLYYMKDSSKNKNKT